MVDDPLRTNPLLKSIRKMVHKGDVVADIGAGLGILSIEAARAGAKKIYAIECDPEAARELRSRLARASLGEKIEVIEAISFEVELPQKADVVLCETVGSFAFDENILAILLDAEKNLLQKGGKILPQRLELWGALAENLEGPDEESFILEITPDLLVSAPVLIASVDFQETFCDFIHEISSFSCTKDAEVGTIALWPKVLWCDGEATDASPEKPATHWKQGMLRLEKKRMTAGEAAKVEIFIGPHPDDPLAMTERLWRWR
jgi:predicted RNA methylase